MKPSKIPSPARGLENEAFWRRHMALHQSSKITGSHYCRLNKVDYDRFNYWRQKLSKTASPLVAIKLKPETVSIQQVTLCTLHLSQGRTLEIHDQQTLFALLEKL